MASIARDGPTATFVDRRGPVTWWALSNRWPAGNVVTDPTGRVAAPARL